MSRPVRLRSSLLTPFVLGLGLLLGPVSVLGLAGAAAGVDETGRQGSTSVTASYSTTTPVYGSTVTVAGTVRPYRRPSGAGRYILLLRWETGAKKWRVIVRQRLTSNSYGISFTASKFGPRTYTTFVPEIPAYRAGQSRNTVINTRRLPTAVSAALTDGRVHPKGKVTVRGALSTAGTKVDRPVRLYRKLPSGWRLVASARTGPKARYAMSVPTWFFTHSRLRVQAAATTTSAAGWSPVRKLHVVPGYSPKGKARHWNPLSTSHRYRWNGCRTVINYRVNPNGAGASFIKDVKAAARRVQVAGGIRLRYLGRTRAIPKSKRGWPGDTHLVVAMARPGQSAWSLAGSRVGVGGVVRGRYARDAHGRMVEIQRGGVILDKTFRWKPGMSDARNSRGKVLLHELGHAMGMGHVQAMSQVMFPDTRHANRFGKGDLFYLRTRGHMGGCSTPGYGRTTGRDVPAPTPYLP